MHGYRKCLSRNIKRLLCSVLRASRRVSPDWLLKHKNVLDEGVIKNLEPPTENYAPMVIAFKPPYDVRIGCDFREWNQSLNSEMHQMPTLNELSAKFTFLGFGVVWIPKKILADTCTL